MFVLISLEKVRVQRFLNFPETQLVRENDKRWDYFEKFMDVKD